MRPAVATALLLAALAGTASGACPFARSPSPSGGCPFGCGSSSATPNSVDPTRATLALAAADYLAASGGDADVTFPPVVRQMLAAREKEGGEDAGPSTSSPSATTTSAHRRSLRQVPPDWRPAIGDYVPHTALGAAKAALETVLPQTQKAKWDRYLSAWKAGNHSLDAIEPKSGWAVRSDADRLGAIKAEREADAENKSSVIDDKLAKAEQVYASLIIPNIYGLLTRLAFHDCGPFNPGLAAITANATASPPGRTGGCNGSVRYEFQQSNNLDLFLAWPWVDAGKKALDKLHPGAFSYADCIAIAASVAVAKATGPIMHVGYGRPDASGPDPRTGVTHDPATDRQLTGARGVEAMLSSWAAFGHSAETLTTLLGAHTFGVSSQHAPIGLLTPQSIIFSKRYYERVRDGAGYFPSDDALRYSPVTSALVDAYAENESLFFEAFKREFTAMTWWGVAADRQGVVG